MITAALAFIHGRKWLVELIIAALIVSAVAWWHHVTYVAGMNEVRKQDQAALDQAKVAADLETARLKGVADAAEKAHNEEHGELIAYRSADPLHGGLCPSENNRFASLHQGSGPEPLHAGTSTGAEAVQPMPARDPEPSGSGNADVRHLLDVLAGRADEVSSTLREFQSRMSAGERLTENATRDPNEH